MSGTHSALEAAMHEILRIAALPTMEPHRVRRIAEVVRVALNPTPERTDDEQG